MKGFTKGKGKGKKFIPTNNKKKGLKKSDVKGDPLERARQNMMKLPQADPVKLKKEMIRKKQSLGNPLKITGVNFNIADDFDIKYSIDEDGELAYNGDIGKALETMGARKLTTKEVGVLIDDDDDTDVTSQEFYKDNKEAEGEYVAEKTSDHTQNFGSILQDDYGFGTFKVDGRELLSVRPQHTDDGEGIYDIGLIEDVEGVGKENKTYYAVSLFDPRLSIRFDYNGDKFEVTKSNGREGFVDLNNDGDFSVDKETENKISGEYDENFEKALSEFKKK